MKIYEITDYLESIAPLNLQEDYDNCGLIVGNKNNTIEGVLITLDCTEKVIEEAIEHNCQLIIAHHPIVFQGLKTFSEDHYIQRTLILAIKNNISIYAIHTNLDNIKNGVNKTIVQKLGLIDPMVLKPKRGFIKKLTLYCPIENSQSLKEKLWQSGAGEIGKYSQCSFTSEGIGTFKGNNESNPSIGVKNKNHQLSESKIELILPSYLEKNILKTLFEEHPYEEVSYELCTLDNFNSDIGSGMYGKLKKAIHVNDFFEYLKKTMKTDLIRFTNPHKEFIETVAVCGGSGSFLLQDAMAIKADIFISSDFKYHQFFEADNKIIIADIGHYESEQFTKDLLYEILKEKFTKFATRLSRINTNPINYLK